MVKIFLVEDESTIRETLRDSVPWKQHGFDFVGEAGDGEMALPLLRQQKPDVLITDIRMPFMDGLELSKQILREFPKMKIIILSGYDDFEYARQAIGIGVERYLLKPITKSALLDALEEIKEKIEAEQAQQSYLERFRQETQEYEQYTRRRFLEQVMEGRLTVHQIYDRAEEMGVDLAAESYAIALFSLPEEDETDQPPSRSAEAREAIMEFFLKYPEYLISRWNLNTYMVLVKGPALRIDQDCQRCIDFVRRQFAAIGAEQDWHIAMGDPVSRLSALAESYRAVSRLWAYRHILPHQHILTARTVDLLAGAGGNRGLDQLDPEKVAPGILRSVLHSGELEELPSFVEQYVLNVAEALESNAFCQFLMLSVRFSAASFLQKLEIPQQELLSRLSCSAMIGRTVSQSELKDYIYEVLRRAMELRDNASTKQGRSLLKKAAAYIDRHYTEEKLSLNQVAQEINISANYLSAIFSQELGKTFTEYVTGKRMELARELLRTTDKRSGEVAFAVGYRDPHYFSFLFKKTQGCTPKEYRAGGKVQ